MMNLKQKVKDWMLPIAMLAGASAYLVYYSLPSRFHSAGTVISEVIGFVQPLLIFMMLFLTFCRVRPSELRPRRWHLWLLLIQSGLFSVLGFVAFAMLRWIPAGNQNLVVLVEGAMLCLICPTATAAAVVTRKLGGDVPGITTYTVLINMVVAVIVPLVVPLVRPLEGMSFWPAFCMIIAKIFPLLIMPCLCAWLVRYLLPGLHKRLLNYPDLAFYLWSVALTLAIAVTTKYIIKSDIGLALMSLLCVVSLLCCVFQFALGRYMGGRMMSSHRSQADEKVTAGQSLGQKNTVFAIWMGYTFLTPETAIAGGFYTIWHNLFNAWQLYRKGKETAR